MSGSRPYGTTSSSRPARSSCPTWSATRFRTWSIPSSSRSGSDSSLIWLIRERYPAAIAGLRKARLRNVKCRASSGPSSTQWPRARVLHLASMSPLDDSRRAWRFASCSTSPRSREVLASGTLLILSARSPVGEHRVVARYRVEANHDAERQSVRRHNNACHAELGLTPVGRGAPDPETYMLSRVQRRPVVVWPRRRRRLATGRLPRRAGSPRDAAARESPRSRCRRQDD
jgi:hypothetical protein